MYITDVRGRFSFSRGVRISVCLEFIYIYNINNGSFYLCDEAYFRRVQAFVFT